MNLHNIPGLSEKYVYANDDFLFAKNFTVNDFFKEEKYIFFAQNFKTECEYSCHQKPSTYCDPNCNISKIDRFRHSNINGNRLLNTVYPPRERRGLAHVPYAVDKPMMILLQNMFEYEFEKTSRSKVRDISDYSIGFIYFNFLIDEQLENEGKEVDLLYEEEGFVMVDKDVSGVVMNL